MKSQHHHSSHSSGKRRFSSNANGSARVNGKVKGKQPPATLDGQQSNPTANDQEALSTQADQNMTYSSNRYGNRSPDTQSFQQSTYPASSQQFSSFQGATGSTPLSSAPASATATGTVHYGVDRVFEMNEPGYYVQHLYIDGFDGDSGQQLEQPYQCEPSRLCDAWDEAMVPWYGQPANSITSSGEAVYGATTYSIADRLALSDYGDTGTYHGNTAGMHN